MKEIMQFYHAVLCFLISFRHVATAACSAGQYLDGFVCVKCQLGSYNPTKGVNICIPCDFGETTYGDGSISSSQCASCNAGKFGLRSVRKSFSYTGSYQRLAVPTWSTSMIVDIYGAQGGKGCGADGGLGGRVNAIIDIIPGEDYYLYVGGRGGDDGNVYNQNGGKGGFNGGGSYSYYNNYNCGGGGGGASDIRTKVDESLSRLVVAGGGGGGYCYRTFGGSNTCAQTSYLRNGRPGGVRSPSSTGGSVNGKGYDSVVGGGGGGYIGGGVSNENDYWSAYVDGGTNYAKTDIFMDSNNIRSGDGIIYIDFEIKPSTKMDSMMNPGVSSVCLDCPYGTFNPNIGTNSSCLQCPIGTYNNKTGSSSDLECFLCPNGYYGDRKGLKLCNGCPIGK